MASKENKPAPIKVSADTPLQISSGGLCEICNLTPGRLSQLDKVGLIIKMGRNEYDLIECLKLYIRYLQNGNSGSSSTGSDDGEVTGEDYHLHRARLYKARADAAEMDAAQLRGELHDATAIENVWTDMISSSRSKLLSMPTRIAASVQGLTDISEIKSRVEDAVIECLNELTQYDPERLTIQTIPKDLPEVEATTQTND